MEKKKLTFEMIAKATPHEVKIEFWMDTKCKCGYVFSVSYPDGYYKVPYENRTNYCPNCGQLLQWPFT